MVSSTIADWTVEKAVRAGADAIKLLVYYHPDAAEEPRRHQQDLVRQVGELCVQHDRPFLLEVVSYAREEPDTKGIDFARRKPSLVIRSAEEFSQPEYRVDVLKLEFPANLKFCLEFCNGAFDGVAREAAYNVNEVQEFCNAVDEAAKVPWVILSAAVDIAEFLINVEFATLAGASGFLCGRAIWKDALEYYPDEEALTEWLETDGVYNFLRANAAAENALPWFEHPPFDEMEDITLAGVGPEWYRNY
jgi:tagatose 1,6-diphosphate aldolase